MKNLYAVDGESSSWEEGDSTNKNEIPTLTEDLLFSNSVSFFNLKSQYSKMHKASKSNHEKYEKINELFDESENPNKVLTLSLTNIQFKLPLKTSKNSMDNNNQEKQNISDNDNKNLLLQKFNASKMQIAKMKSIEIRSKEGFDQTNKSIKEQHTNIENIIKFKYQIQNTIDQFNNHNMIDSLFMSFNELAEKFSLYEQNIKQREEANKDSKGS